MRPIRASAPTQLRTERSCPALASAPLCARRRAQHASGTVCKRALPRRRLLSAASHPRRGAAAWKALRPNGPAALRSVLSSVTVQPAPTPSRSTPAATLMVIYTLSRFKHLLSSSDARPRFNEAETRPQTVSCSIAQQEARNSLIVTITIAHTTPGTMTARATTRRSGGRAPAAMAVCALLIAAGGWPSCRGPPCVLAE